MTATEDDVTIHLASHDGAVRIKNEERFSLYPNRTSKYHRFFKYLSKNVSNTDDIFDLYKRLFGITVAIIVVAVAIDVVLNILFGGLSSD